MYHGWYRTYVVPVRARTLVRSTYVYLCSRTIQHTHSLKPVRTLTPWATGHRDLHTQREGREEVAGTRAKARPKDGLVGSTGGALKGVEG